MNNQVNSAAVRKIHNLLSSGAVTVTGPNQPRILKQKIVGGGVATTTTTVSSSGMTSNLHQSQQMLAHANRCYVCDDTLGANQAQHQLTEMQTTHTLTKFPNKIGQLVGDAFMVIVSIEDVVCSRCTNLINYLDRLENDVERVKTNLMNLLHKKYGINDDSGGTNTSSSGGVSSVTVGGVNAAVNNNVTSSQAPPNKIQKLNSGAAVSAVQQMKISTASPTSTIQQQSAGTQTLQRKTTKIYKCLSCEYKTSDMRLFNTHYETCKHQNFQCKNCKKIFSNFGAMKQHMVREHNTAMDNTCAVCHINFVSEQALRKHMEINHSTNVVVTSTTTLPVGLAAAPAADSITAAVNAAQASPGTTTALYSCNNCQYKSTDKALFDEHMRKHITSIKSKPFKCRLCAQRFETREAATTHAKQHQGNVFKCGTCFVSFSKRELLVKHFEEHQNHQAQHQQQQQVQVQQQQQPQQQAQMITIKQQSPQASQNMLTTQKLLQETIDEALSDTTTSVANTAPTDVGGATANNIRFFSCHLCSLTFIQENYYNQHMDTHRRDTSTVHKKSNSGGNTISALNAAAILSEAAQQEANEMSHHSQDMNTHHQHQQQANSINTSGGANISEADIESIFEKMHSDKGDSGTVVTTTSASGNSDQVVITSQAGTEGGITFNITIPGQEGTAVTTSVEDHMKNTPTTTTAPVSLSIDMPMLDQPDESTHSASNSTPPIASSNSEMKNAGNANTTGPVSMPSLDDDNDEPNANVTSEQISSTSGNEDSKTKADSSETIEKSGKPSSDDGKHEIKAEPASSSTEQQASTDSASANSNVKNTSEASQESTTSTMEHEQEQHHAVSSAEEAEHEQQMAAAEAAASSEAAGEHHVAMELDEATMQAQVDGGQIKFILNESGQLLQLDNHIITDADGNQILVQDPEQIQQLLQSVGVLHSGEGLDGETLQMMTDGNGQMVLVQGENNETQLIDASLLNSEGQLVIQQSQDGEGGAHVISEDGTRIPVSVSYTEDGQPIVQVQQQVMDTSVEEEGVMEKDGGEGSAEAEDSEKMSAD